MISPANRLRKPTLPMSPDSRKDSEIKIHIYTICWNEERMLPFFLRHYEQIAERIVVYDNGSDDASQEIVCRHPIAELRHFDSHGESREDIEIDVKSNVWKESRRTADFVIICDVDEFLFHPHLNKYLLDCRRRGITMPIPDGYQMVSERFPTTTGQIYEEVKRGLYHSRWSKRVIFDPHAIEEIHYAPGCHEADPVGKIFCDRVPQLKLLHFKFLGIDYLITRYRELGARKSRHDLSHQYGHQYFLSDDYLKAKFANYQARSTQILSAGETAFWSFAEKSVSS